MMWGLGLKGEGCLQGMKKMKRGNCDDDDGGGGGGDDDDDDYYLLLLLLLLLLGLGVLLLRRHCEGYILNHKP